MPVIEPMRAVTLWPEWCPAFPGVRLTDGTASPLDKPVENRPRPPWSTIAPTVRGPGLWFAMHAGKHLGGRPGRDDALMDVVVTAHNAGWEASMASPRLHRLRRGDVHIDLAPDLIVTSAIVALIRITRFVGPGIDGPWRFKDRWGWYLEVKALSEPVPCMGAQGLWTVPVDVVRAVHQRLAW